MLVTADKEKPRAVCHRHIAVDRILAVAHDLSRHRVAKKSCEQFLFFSGHREHSVGGYVDIQFGDEVCAELLVQQLARRSADMITRDLPCLP